MRLLEPPLTPDGDEARRVLRRELLHPDYHQDNLVLRLLDWLARLLDRGLGAARDAPPLSVFAAMLIGLLLVAAVAWLVGTARRSRSAPRERRPMMPDEHVTAAHLRARAERALAEGRHGDALVDAFRAVAQRQVEEGRIDDVPGATAHEVALALAEVFPHEAAEVHACGALFDLVRYGGRAATPEQAQQVLALDSRLGERRVPQLTSHGTDRTTR